MAFLDRPSELRGGTLARKNQADEACLDTPERVLHRGFRCVSNPLDLRAGALARVPGTSEFHLEV
jgi:hypothetical protein